MSKRARSRSRPRTTSVKPEKISLMTPKTKDFIQKICYKKTASIDMTKHGFITESRMGPINVYIKPLRVQIQKIIDASQKTGDNHTIVKKRRSALPAAPSPSPQEGSCSIDSSMKKYVKAAKFKQKSVVFSL